MARMTRTKRRLILVSTVLTAAIVAIGAGYVGLKWYRGYRSNVARAEGYRLFEQGDWEHAIDPLSTYVGRHRDDLDAILKLAECRAKVPLPNGRHLVTAAGYYKAALSLAPESVMALAGLIDAYSRLGFGAELEVAANRLLQLDPKNMTALEAIVRLARSRGQWTEAINGTNAMIGIEPDRYAWRFLMLDLMRAAGEDVGVRTALVESWIAQGEPDGRYRLMLAALALDANRPDEARRQVSLAADGGMPDTVALASLLDLLDTLQVPDVAARALQKASSSGLNPKDLATMQARRHWRAGRLVEARAALDRELASVGVDQQELLRWSVVVAEAARDFATSDAAIARLRGLEKGRSAVWADAIVASRLADTPGGQFAPIAAMEALRKAIQLDPRDAVLLLRAGDVLLRSGETDDAIRAYRDAFEREDRRWALAGVQLATSLLAAGRTDEGFRLARELTGAFQDNPSAYLVFGQACEALVREGRTPAMVDPSLPLGISASTVLRNLYDALGRPPSYLAPLIAVLVSEKLDADALKLATEGLADPKTPADVLLRSAEFVTDRRFGDVPDRLIATAEARGGAPIALLRARCRLLVARGDAKAARAKATVALESTSIPTERAELSRMIAEAAIAASDADSTSLLADCLGIASDLETAEFVLAQEAAWRDESLVQAAIARQRALAGPRASRTVISDAIRVLRFHRNAKDEMAAAISAVNELLLSNRESPSALATMSRLLASSQPPDFAGAAKFMEQALLLQPARRDLIPELVTQLQAAGDFSTASRYLGQYMRSSGQDPADSRLAAGLLLSQGDYAAALPALQAIADASDRETDLIALSDAQRRAGRLKDAEQTLHRTLASPNHTALSTLSYVELLARSGRVDEAKKFVLEDARSPQPALPPLEKAAVLARLELDFGEPEAAGVHVEEALRLDSDNPRVALLAARYRRALGDERGAIAVVEQALEKSPRNAELLAFATTALMADPLARASADTRLESLKDANPALAALLRVVRSSATADGSIQPNADVLAAAEKLTEEFPTFTPAWVIAAQLHQAAGRVDDAIRLARRGMLRLPTESAPAELATALLIGQRRYAEAKDTARAWRDLTADSPFVADIVLAEIALREGKADRCLAILDVYAPRLSAISTKDPVGIALYTLASLRAGRVEASYDLLADRLNKDSAALGEWLRGVGQSPSPAAIAALDRAASRQVDEGSLLGMVAEYATLARRRDGARAASKGLSLFSRLSESLRDSLLVRALGADLRCASGDVTSGVREYESILASIPAADQEAVLRWENLDSAARERLGPSRAAMEYVNNNLASALAAVGVELDKALAAIERAILIDSANSSLFDTKARVLLARREVDEARRVAETARMLPDSGVELDLTLAEIEIAAGRFSEARRWVGTAEKIVLADTLIDPIVVEALADVKRRLDAVASTSSGA